jgi:hypothetical protein
MPPPNLKHRWMHHNCEPRRTHSPSKQVQVCLARQSVDRRFPTTFASSLALHCSVCRGYPRLRFGGPNQQRRGNGEAFPPHHPPHKVQCELPQARHQLLRLWIRSAVFFVLSLALSRRRRLAGWHDALARARALSAGTQTRENVPRRRLAASVESCALFCCPAARGSPACSILSR